MVRGRVWREEMWRTYGANFSFALLPSAAGARVWLELLVCAKETQKEKGKTRTLTKQRVRHPHRKFVLSKHDRGTCAVST